MFTKERRIEWITYTTWAMVLILYLNFLIGAIDEIIYLW